MNSYGPYLFAYGTLQKQEVQLQIFNRLLTGCADVLEGFRLEAIEITDPLFLSTGQGRMQQTLIFSGNKIHVVKGTVFEISEEELLLSDSYEPSNYKRKNVFLRSGKTAWVYVAV